MASEIRYTSTYSREKVCFLDVLVHNTNGQITTDLYTKPNATHDYLHRSSFHPPSFIRSIPKAQFIRIRRICSRLFDYDRHSEAFIKYFMRRGYNEKSLRTSATEARAMNREDLLTPKPKPASSNRIVFSVRWHPKFRNIPTMLRQCYNHMLRQAPQMKQVFPDPPMVAFRRNRNTKDTLVHSRHGHLSAPTQQQPPPSNCLIQPNMNNTGFIKNSTNTQTYKIAGGACSQANVIYAAECTKHNLIYIGQTSSPLNIRFNGHRSDITKNPDRCHLPKHYNIHKCDFTKDLKVSILEANITNEERRLTREDIWIARLNTLAPMGINVDLNEYGKSYYKLP